jgi:hypothetical protein
MGKERNRMLAKQHGDAPDNDHVGDPPSRDESDFQKREDRRDTNEIEKQKERPANFG